MEEYYIAEILLMIMLKDKELYMIKMEKLNMMDIGLLIERKEMENISLKMEIIIKDISKMEKEMEKEHYITKME